MRKIIPTNKLSTVSYTSPSSQVLVLCCNEIGLQPAHHAFLKKLGVANYTTRTKFGSVNCLVKNDSKSRVDALNTIKDFIQHEKVREIIIFVHTGCAADKWDKSHKSIQFQAQKAKRAESEIMTYLCRICEDLKIQSYVIASKGEEHVLYEVIKPAKSKTAAAGKPN